MAVGVDQPGQDDRLAEWRPVRPGIAYDQPGNAGRGSGREQRVDERYRFCVGGDRPGQREQECADQDRD